MNKSTSMKDLLNEIERGDSGYVEKHKSIATVYRVMSGGKKLQVKLGKTGKKVVIDAKDIDILPESTMNERPTKLPRQLKDKNKEMLVAKDGNVIVIDKKDWKKYEKKGYLVAENFTDEQAYNGLFRFKDGRGQTYVGKVVRKDGGTYTLTIDPNSSMYYDRISPRDMEYLGDASDQGKKGLPYLSAHPKNFKKVQDHDISGKVLVFKDGVEVYLHPSFVKGKTLKDINKTYRLKLTQDELKEGLDEAHSKWITKT